MVKYADLVLVYKILSGPASPVLSEFVKKANSRRASDKGDCIIPCRKSTFGRSAFSYQTSHSCSSLSGNFTNQTAYGICTKINKDLFVGKTRVPTPK